MFSESQTSHIPWPHQRGRDAQGFPLLRHGKTPHTTCALGLSTCRWTWRLCSVLKGWSSTSRSWCLRDPETSFRNGCTGLLSLRSLPTIKISGLSFYEGLFSTPSPPPLSSCQCNPWRRPHREPLTVLKYLSSLATPGAPGGHTPAPGQLRRSLPTASHPTCAHRIEVHSKQ